MDREPILPLSKQPQAYFGWDIFTQLWLATLDPTDRVVMRDVVDYLDRLGATPTDTTHGAIYTAQARFTSKLFRNPNVVRTTTRHGRQRMTSLRIGATRAFEDADWHRDGPPQPDWSSYAEAGIPYYGDEPWNIAHRYQRKFWSREADAIDRRAARDAMLDINDDHLYREPHSD